MASQTAIVGTGAEDASFGTAGAWTTPTNITAADNARAVRILASGTTRYLKGTNCGFTIPTGATINGITVEVEKRCPTPSTAIVDARVRIVKADGSIGTTDKANGVTAWDANDLIATYGSSSDLWGETWTPADINDADFGAVIAAAYVSGTNPSVQVDFIRITVDYTAGGSALTKSLSDTITASDVLGKAAAHPLADTITASDARVKVMGMAKADSLTASDSASRGVGKATTDSLTASDSLSRQWLATRTLADDLAFADAISKATGMPLADSLVLADGLTVSSAPFTRPWTYDESPSVTYGGADAFTFNADQDWNYEPVTG